MNGFFFSAIFWSSVIGIGLVGADRKNDLSMGNNDFAFDLYKKIGNENKGKNLFLSPISISTAFGIVHLGARGNTQAQLKAVLRLDKIGADAAINEAYKELLTGFAMKENNYTLNLANRLFGSREFQPNPEFLNESQKYFQSSLESLDFKNQTDVSRVHINDWVAKETNGKIKDLFPSGTIDRDTVLVIVNAIYFNGVWKRPFSKVQTKRDTFHISSGERVDMEMMNKRSYMDYYDSSELDCQVLELPYVGSKASMVIFLPRGIDDLSKLEERMTAEKLSYALRRISNAEIKLKFPKFEMEQSISLKKFLQMIGLTDVFSANDSDLSGISANGLFVNDAKHKSYVKVDEVGTEAAAATGVDIFPTSVRPPPIDVTVNRPFLFMILEKNTNTVLFLGRLVRPPVSGEAIGTFGEAAALSDGERLKTSKILLFFSSVVVAFVLLYTVW